MAPPLTLAMILLVFVSLARSLPGNIHNRDLLLVGDNNEPATENIVATLVMHMKDDHRHRPLAHLDDDMPQSSTILTHMESGFSIVSNFEPSPTDNHWLTTSNDGHHTILPINNGNLNWGIPQ